MDPPPALLLGALQDVEEEVAVRMVPAERAVMLLSVSRAARAAMERVRPAARVKAKGEQGIETVEGGLCAFLRWCRVTMLELSRQGIRAEGVARLAAVLGQSPSLAHLDLGNNNIGDEEAGWPAAVLGQCPSLAHLDLSYNNIGAEGAGRLATALGECPSLAHLNLSWNNIGAEGAGRLAAVLWQCPSLTHLNLDSNDIGSENAELLRGSAPPPNLNLFCR